MIETRQGYLHKMFMVAQITKWTMLIQFKGEGGGDISWRSVSFNYYGCILVLIILNKFLVH